MENVYYSRTINRIIIWYIFPIPRIEDLMDCLGGARYFSKIDLKSGYYPSRMKEGDEWKAIFKTTEGLYEWLIMSFGLTSAPITFMIVMNEVLKDYIGVFTVVYLDNILIFHNTKEEHVKHLELVLRKLQEEKLIVNLEKSDFMKEELVYLGFLVSQGSLKMDKDKVEAILSSPTPRSTTEVGRFHGLAQFYSNFVRRFSEIVHL